MLQEPERWIDVEVDGETPVRGWLPQSRLTDNCAIDRFDDLGNDGNEPIMCTPVEQFFDYIYLKEKET